MRPPGTTTLRDEAKDYQFLSYAVNEAIASTLEIDVQEPDRASREALLDAIATATVDRGPSYSPIQDSDF
jgi:hypothetical protein